MEILLMLACSLGLILVFFLFEVSSRRYRLNPEEMRRVAHVVGTMFGIAIALFLPRALFVASTIAFSLIMVLSRTRHVFSHIHGVSRKTFGAELLPLGLLGAYLLSNGNPQIFVPVFLIIGIADPACGYVTHRTNSRKLGFSAFVVCTLVVLAIFLPLNPLTLLGTALFLGLVEQVCTYGFDNVMVPLAATLVLTQFL